MSPAIMLELQLALGYVPWLFCFGAYFWPRLATMEPVAAQRAIAALHSFRFFGLVFILPGVVGPNLPSEFAVFAAWGDFATGLLAMAALLAVRLRPVFWTLVVAFNGVGALDIIVDYFHGLQAGLLPGQLGSTYAIPVIYVPLLMITHFAAFYLLVRPQSKTVNIPATNARATFPARIERAMASTEHYAVFLAAAGLLAATPGPGIFYVADQSLSGGRKEGVASSCGTGLGGMVHVCAGSLGVSAIVLASGELFTLLKLLGAAYLIWMGVRAIQAARRDASAALETILATPAIGTRKAFRDGVLVEALNPKTAAFFLAFIPQFVDAGSGRVALQFALLGSISVVLNTLADVVVALAAGAVRAGATARPDVVRGLRAASGAGMIALGVGLLFTRRSAS